MPAGTRICADIDSDHCRYCSCFTIYSPGRKSSKGTWAEINDVRATVLLRRSQTGATGSRQVAAAAALECAECGGLCCGGLSVLLRLGVCAEEQSDDDNSEASAESAGGTIDWDIPLKLPRSVLLAAQQAREAEAAASAAVRVLKLPSCSNCRL